MIENIVTRNVHQALPKAMNLMEKYGQIRSSRNGDVLQVPFPVVTSYLQPQERVLFWPQRDANPFFHLYESLWMLGGRNDVKSVSKYVKRMEEYSDDGKTIRGAYGHRWRTHFEHDQLDVIVDRLDRNPHDRRCVVGMWDPYYDLRGDWKDTPCNLVATVQINSKRELDLTVFCRSNDILWGAYGANAVHFSFLQEYLALGLEIPIGTFHQISVNWHAYTNVYFGLNIPLETRVCPYSDGEVRSIPMTSESLENIERLLDDENRDFYLSPGYSDLWSDMVATLLYAHAVYRSNSAPEKYEMPLEIINKIDPRIDWARACREWIERRQMKWEEKMRNE